MSNPTTPKGPRWRRLLFYAAVLVGLPVTGWAIGESSHLLAAVAGVASVTGLMCSFSAKRCPGCGSRLYTISYPASNCPKCGTPYHAPQPTPINAPGSESAFAGGVPDAARLGLNRSPKTLGMKTLGGMIRMTILCTVLGMIGWAMVWFISIFVFRHVDFEWESGPVIEVGSGYSIALETRWSSPVGLAEYDQRLRVFDSGVDGRTGKEIGTAELFPNTGGRQHVQIEERHGMTDVDLTVPRATNVSGGPATHVDPAKERVFVGTYSGESHPLKFIPGTILPEHVSHAKIQVPERPGQQADAGQPDTDPNPKPESEDGNKPQPEAQGETGP